MLKKIRLFHQIRKFYNLFGTEVGANFITKLSDMTADNLYDVMFDINEILSANAHTFCSEAYALDAWLRKLCHKIETAKENAQ